MVSSIERTPISTSTEWDRGYSSSSGDFHLLKVIKCSLHYSVRLDHQSPVPNLTLHYLVAKVSWDLRQPPRQYQCCFPNSYVGGLKSYCWKSQHLILVPSLASVRVDLCTPTLIPPGRTCGPESQLAQFVSRLYIDLIPVRSGHKKGNPWMGKSERALRLEKF